MKKDKIIYWILTGLMCLALGFGAVMNAMSTPESVELINHQLGFPTFITPFVGVAKILAIIAILVPGFPRVKEWAYAGLAYDLIGAIAAHIAIGAPASAWAALSVFLLFIFASYFYHHKLLNATKAG